MRPSGRLLFFVGALLGLALISAFWPSFGFIFIAAVGMIVIAAIIDAWQGRGIPNPAIEREAPGAFALGTWADIALNVRGATSSRVAVVDFVPYGFEQEFLPQTVNVIANRWIKIAYRVKPVVRGDHIFQGCRLRIYSPLGLWTFRRNLEVSESVRVYPNFSEVMKYALLDVHEQLSQAGIRRRQRRGEGLEFHQLREYRVGDTFRQIDWKATARTNKLISKDYQDEHDQQVVFLLDSGRRMLAQEDDYSHFDHALNAMLLLAYVAVRQGDAIGFLTFGGETQWMKPQKGASAINQLLNNVYKLQPKPIASDYQSAATNLMINQRRRALVVVLTNVRDEDADDLTASLTLLQRRHLVLLASLRESGLDESLKKRVDGFDDALRFAATSQYLGERRRAHEALQMPGVMLQDVTCAELPAAITNSYVQIKRAGAL